jgi:predicted TIM-barrel enzyme
MSNSKVRKQLEAQAKNEKLVAAYKKKSNFILDTAMCKAYFKDSGMSVNGIVEKILKSKYNLPWQEKIIRKVLMEIRGKHNPMVAIPQFKYEKSTHDIIKEFVERNLMNMCADCGRNRELYPLAFKDMLEEFT